MNIPHQYRINAPQTIFEVFDDEIIIVSFFDGSYYSVRGSAAIIWQAIHAGASTQRIADHFAAAYPANSNLVIEQLLTYITELARLSLIVPAEEVAGHTAEIEMPMLPGAFQPPMLESYNDMQDLLLLDPIHDVDDMGWPQKAPDAQATRA